MEGGVTFVPKYKEEHNGENNEDADHCDCDAICGDFSVRGPWEWSHGGLGFVSDDG